MPYVEVLAPPVAVARKHALAQRITHDIVRVFGVTPSTVTLYFSPVEPGNYVHEGQFEVSPAGPRVFVKLHAYRRDPALRRMLAQSLTPALAQCFDTSSANVAIYFMDRQPDEVAHDGSLASDGPNSLVLPVELP